MFPIFVFLLVASIFGLILGLVKPTLVLHWGAKRTRLRAIGWYCLFTVFFFIAAGVTAPKSQHANQNAAIQESPIAPIETYPKKETAAKETINKPTSQNKDTETNVDNGKTIHVNVGDEDDKYPEQNIKNKPQKQINENATNDISFKFDLKTFINRYNASAKKSKQAIIVKTKSSNKDDKSGKVHTLIVSNKNIVFTVVTNNNGNVKESVMLGSGDGTPASGVHIILGMASFFDVFDPKITGDGRGEILRGLGILGGTIPEKSIYTRQNVKYTLFNTKGIGIWLVAEPVS